jgi:hypothetical protein
MFIDRRAQPASSAVLVVLPTLTAGRWEQRYLYEIRSAFNLTTTRSAHLLPLHLCHQHPSAGASWLPIEQSLTAVGPARRGTKGNKQLIIGAEQRKACVCVKADDHCDDMSPSMHACIIVSPGSAVGCLPRQDAVVATLSLVLPCCCCRCQRGPALLSRSGAPLGSPCLAV